MPDLPVKRLPADPMPGFYGKVPLRGDFVSHRLPEAFVETWDRWVSSMMVESRMRIGSRWPDVFAATPIRRFVLGPGLCLRESVAGLMIPSADSVGRQFPLVLACRLRDQDGQISPDSWFDRAETVLLDLLDAEDIPDAIEDAAGKLDAPALPQGPAMEPGWYDRPPVGFDPAIGIAAGKDRSVWWTGDPGRPDLLVCHGLPSAEDFIRFLSLRSPASAHPAMVGPFIAASAGLSHPGLVRQHNEDAFLNHPDLGLWAVADGLGGHQAGDHASNLLVDRLRGLTCPDNAQSFLQEVAALIRAVNDELRHTSSGNPDGAVIASTVVALLVSGRHFACLWAGDSRLYLLRDGVLHQLSTDHSEVQDLVAAGMVAPDEASAHPRSNMVTRAVGADDDLLLDVTHGEIAPGDRFVLCSDGLPKTVSDAEILALAEGVPIERMPRVLIDAALARGGPDNVTVVAVEVTEP
jgi:type VI secretion system ImpM family protein